MGSMLIRLLNVLYVLQELLACISFFYFRLQAIFEMLGNSASSDGEEGVIEVDNVETATPVVGKNLFCQVIVL